MYFLTISVFSMKSRKTKNIKSLFINSYIGQLRVKTNKNVKTREFFKTLSII